MDPLLLIKSTLGLIRFGMSVWVRLLGKKAVPVVAALTVLSTLVVIVIEGCDLA